MTPSPALPGIRFPIRAERLESDLFEDYRVFVEFWDQLTTHLSDAFRALHLREEASILGIHAPQGAGKTMFARQLIADFESTREAIRDGVVANSDNLWHRIASGSSLDAETITTLSAEVDVEQVSGDEAWAKNLSDRVKTRGKPTIAVLDSIENVYFVRGLVDVDPASLMALRASGGVADPAGEELVRLARNELAGTLIILLTNDEAFLDRLRDEVERRHEDSFTKLPLPLPDSASKERVIRANTNRLNGVSYWACLDRAGPAEKEAVRDKLLDATTFPGAFKAVDRAIRSSVSPRPGRPARRNLLTLVVLTDDETAAVTLPGAVALGEPEVEDRWCASVQFDTGWVPRSMGERAAAMLESEWLLRVTVLGGDFCRALLRAAIDVPSGKACKALLQTFHAVLGGTSALQERENFRDTIHSQINDWPDVAAVDLADFWGRGQNRSTLYEPPLKGMFPTYDTASQNFLNYRPDLVVSQFSPCSILQATSKTGIPAAIQRNAHIMEFTATRAATAASINSYLNPKLLNYVRITEQ